MSLFILDHPGWYTLAGLIFKYTLIAVVMCAGVALFSLSKDAYFLLGWLIVVPLPLAAMSIAAQSLPLLRPQAQQELIFVYLWSAIAHIELFVIWIPLFGIALGGPRKPRVHK